MIAFETWKHCGMRFIAVPNGHGFHVIDETGNNYGAWMTVANFRAEQRQSTELARPIGKSCLVVRESPVVPA